MVSIRIASEDDWPRVSHISQISGYVDYINRVGKNYMRWGTVLMAEDNGEALGFLLLQFQKDRSGWLSGIRVHPDHRKQGVAMALTERALSICSDNSLKEVRMLIHTDNEASIALARSAGFSIMQVLSFTEGILDLSGYDETHEVPKEPIFYDWKVIKPSNIDEIPGKVFRRGMDAIHFYSDGEQKYYHVCRGDQIRGIVGDGIISYVKDKCQVIGVESEDPIEDSYIFRKSIV